MWGGRFASAQDPHFLSFQNSLGFDRRLWREDIAGSAAWARALEGAGVLSKGEREKLERALDELGRELARDAHAFDGAPDEDVHSFVERKLGERVGDLAKKLHTGRSRNDQVATDLKLWLKGALYRLDANCTELMAALVALAERSVDVALPGYTHLQRAQPISAAHHALAYVEMLARDRERLADACDRLDACPLGSGALAGTAWPIDRAKLADDLGFTRGPTRNSLDAVADRDHAIEAVFAATLVCTHLSRLAEDWIFFATQEAGFLELSEDVSTGSSLMPQKKNPDALELVRGKCGRVLGHLVGLVTTLKGLPLAYDKDLQEDKEALFDALDTAAACLAVTALAVRGARWRAERCAAAAASSYQNSTDLADLLVAAGVPFRSAHERAGAAVRRALELGCELEALPAAERARLVPELAALDLARELSTARVLARRAVVGGTAPSAVRAELKRWNKELALHAAQAPVTTPR
ncbi:MAG: argininosuccinate lyase [Planctomycetota bacterium]|nr:MAG: argininosuccinate lyase [Planctomycetota bacterium]